MITRPPGKTGYSVRPIGGVAVWALTRAMERANSEFIFPAIRGAGHFQGTDKAWRAIAGRRLPNVTPHVLRHLSRQLPKTSGWPSQPSRRCLAIP